MKRCHINTIYYHTCVCWDSHAFRITCLSPHSAELTHFMHWKYFTWKKKYWCFSLKWYISLKSRVHINRRSAPSFVFLRRRHLRDSWCSPPAGVHGWWSWESILPCLLHSGLDGGEAGPWHAQRAEWRCNSRWSTRHILNYCGLWCVSQGCSNLCLHRCIHRSQPRSWEHRLWCPKE